MDWKILQLQLRPLHVQNVNGYTLFDVVYLDVVYLTVWNYAVTMVYAWNGSQKT